MAESHSDHQGVYLVKGDDAGLVAQAARALIDELVGDLDPSLVVEEHGGSSADALEIGAVVDACTTPSFLVDRRIVVVRDAGRINAADAARIVEVLENPLDTTILVLAAGAGTIPQSLVKAVGNHGEVIDTSAGSGRARRDWLDVQLRAAPVRLSAGAASVLGEHLGDDVSRLEGILETLASAYGEGAQIGPTELEPYLGSAGAVPPWELTDAIDAGSTSLALKTLSRMMEAGGRSATQILGTLHSHYSSMLRLDGLAMTSGDQAAVVLDIKSSFRAKKLLAQGGRLGSARIGQAVAWIADADLDIKGRTGLDPHVVLEILVARLSRLVRVRAGATRGAPAR
jgi:DNA polymerase-3 subunit delta